MPIAPEISFVIVSWNAKAFLLSCVTSIIETVLENPYEIIVVDNDSTDGSPEAIEERFAQAHVIRSGKNLGFAAGNNRGIEASRGRWICMINSDVELLPGCVDNLVRVLKDDPHAGLAAPRVLNSDRTLQRNCRRFPTLWRSLCSALGLSALFARFAFFGGTQMTWWTHNTRREVEVVSGCFWLVRREALQAIGGLDENFFMYGEDVDWCRRLWLQRWKIVFAPECEAIHHGGGSSRNQPLRFFLAMQEAELRYWRKHHGSVATMLRAGIMLLHQIVRIVARSAERCIRFLRGRDLDYKIARSAACVRWLCEGGWYRLLPVSDSSPWLDERAKHV